MQYTDIHLRSFTESRKCLAFPWGRRLSLLYWNTRACSEELGKFRSIRFTLCAIPREECTRCAHQSSASSFLRPWARSLWSSWLLASATPDLRLPSQPQGITAPALTGNEKDACICSLGGDSLCLRRRWSCSYAPVATTSCSLAVLSVSRSSWPWPSSPSMGRWHLAWPPSTRRDHPPTCEVPSAGCRPSDTRERCSPTSTRYSSTLIICFRSRRSTTTATPPPRPVRTSSPSRPIGLFTAFICLELSKSQQMYHLLTVRGKIPDSGSACIEYMRYVWVWVYVWVYEMPWILLGHIAGTQC